LISHLFPSRERAGSLFA